MKQGLRCKRKIDTEELLNFELDDESSLDLDSLGEDEEVIDLIDLVEKGDGSPLPRTGWRQRRRESIWRS
jgi:hypothetical protein